MAQQQQTIFASVHAPDQRWLDLAEQEPALEPELPIVDTHLHLWDHAGYRYFLEEHVAVVINDDLSNLEYRFSAEDIAALFAQPAGTAAAAGQTLH